ncbi:MAG: hypothetical protein ACKO7N_04425 [Candidatus Nitrosotenuis sp.]
MKIVVIVSDNLHRKIKVAAAEKGTTITAIVIQALSDFGISEK